MIYEKNEKKIEANGIACCINRFANILNLSNIKIWSSSEWVTDVPLVDRVYVRYIIIRRKILKQFIKYINKK